MDGLYLLKFKYFTHLQHSHWAHYVKKLNMYNYISIFFSS